MRRLGKKARNWLLLVSYLLLAVSSIFIRLDTASLPGFPHSSDAGLALGVFYDVLIALLPVWLYFFLAALHERAAVFLAGLLDGLWLVAALACALYFRSTGTKLDWSTVVAHLTHHFPPNQIPPNQNPSSQPGLRTILWEAAPQIYHHSHLLVGAGLGLLSVLTFAGLFYVLKPERYLFKPPSQLKYWPIQGLLSLLVLAVGVGIARFPSRCPVFALKLLGSSPDAIQIDSPVADHFLLRWASE